jgi:hypothetical protein
MAAFANGLVVGSSDPNPTPSKKRNNNLIIQLPLKVYFRLNSPLIRYLFGFSHFPFAGRV